MDYEKLYNDLMRDLDAAIIAVDMERYREGAARLKLAVNKSLAEIAADDLLTAIHLRESEGVEF